jgi:hypothetical protein
MSEQHFEFDLVIHDVVEIAAPPDRAWQALRRLQDWKASVASIESLEGRPGAVGEVLRVGQSAGDRIVYVRMKTLASEPGAWLVQTLETEDGHTTRGYVAYTLHDRSGRTLLVGELLARACLPLAAVPPGHTAEQAAAAVSEATRAKLQSDHLALKRRIEER